MRSIDVQDFGFGLMTKLPPTKQPRGAAIVSLDCDYNGRNIAARRGRVAVLENGPGAALIADFETDEAWVGGSADTVNFVKVEAEADGVQSRKLSATGGGPTVTMELTFAPRNYGTDPLDVFHLWVKALQLPATISEYQAVLRFETSTGNHFQVNISLKTTSPVLTVITGNLLELNLPKYHRFRRQEFTATGSPDWTSITKIFVALIAIGTGTVEIALDNLHRTPGLAQDLFQFRRENGAADFCAVAAGVLYKSNGRRWAQVFSGFDPKAPVYSITSQNRRVMSDGVTTPRVLMDDGSTVYRLGIVTPPKQMTASQILGGGLPDGDYYAQMLWFSSKTGTFSAPDDRVPRTPIITIAAGGNAAGIRFSNLPVSSDPQVTHVVIAIRPSTEPELFFRASDGLFGEVTNGTTTFDFVNAGGVNADLPTLLARSLTAIDPDLDYPSVIDHATGFPVEAHPVFLREAGGRLLAVMAEQPTVLRASRFRQPGSWALDDEFPLGENDQEPLTGIAVTAGHVVAMKRGSVIPGRVVGGAEILQFDPPLSDRGALSHKGMVVIGQALFYRAMDGVYRMEADLVPRKVSDLAQPTWRDLWSPYGAGREAAVALRDTEQVVVFGRSLGSLWNDRGWVTHYRTVQVDDAAPARWPTWAPTIWRMSADVAAEVRPELSSGTGWESWVAADGQVFRLNTGHEDDGRPVSFSHRTALISPDDLLAHVFQYVDLEALCAGSFNLSVGVYLGTALVTDALATASLKGQADVLGSFVLGSDLLGAQQYVQQRINLPVRAARYISVELSLRARAPVQVFKLNLWSSPLGARRIAA